MRMRKFVLFYKETILSSMMVEEKVIVQPFFNFLFENPEIYRKLLERFKTHMLEMK